jgi:Na+-translocating ferredoxin:NAD+ oxidoreductase subunit B
MRAPSLSNAVSRSKGVGVGVTVTVTAAAIDALLPQTQCTQCGYQGCLPYASAIADGTAPINRCPPGGDAGIAKLAALLDQPVIALDVSCGAHMPHRVAVIDEAACIGCAKCLKPCPTDAIIGANKFMHTVMPALCTACELCIPACPVDCISMIEDSNYPSMMDANDARGRFDFHNRRLARDAAERDALLALREATALSNASTNVSTNVSTNADINASRDTNANTNASANPSANREG